MDLNLVNHVLLAPASSPWGEVEAWLKGQGCTLGFLPLCGEEISLGQLLEGGMLAWGGALYGQPGESCVAVEARVGGQRVHTAVVPRSAAGPDFKFLVLGGEGQHATLTRVWLRVYPLPELQLGVRFTFADGASACRVAGRLLQRGVLPVVGVLEGPGPTTLSLSLEGNRHLTAARMDITRRLAREGGGVEIPHNPGDMEILRTTLRDVVPSYFVGWGQVARVWQRMCEAGLLPLGCHLTAPGLLLYLPEGIRDPLLAEEWVELGAIPYEKAGRLDRQLSRSIGFLSEEHP